MPPAHPCDLFAAPDPRWVRAVTLLGLLSAAACGGGTDQRPDAAPDASDSAEAGVDAAPDASAADATADAEAPDSGDMTDGGRDDAGAGEVPVVELDFEGELPDSIDIASCAPTPSQGYEPLGPSGNTFGPTFLRCPTGEAIVVTLTDLPAHTSLSIYFLFAAIDSLDGVGTFPAGDFFRVDLDGDTIFREAFANATESQVQTYVPPFPEIVLARRVDLGFSGPGGFHTDSAYNLGLDPVFHDLPHTASTATLTFSLEGEGVQPLSDESWAIDNLRVVVGNSPRPRPSEDDHGDGGT